VSFRHAERLFLCQWCLLTEGSAFILCEVIATDHLLEMRSWWGTKWNVITAVIQSTSQVSTYICCRADKAIDRQTQGGETEEDKQETSKWETDKYVQKDSDKGLAASTSCWITLPEDTLSHLQRTSDNTFNQTGMSWLKKISGCLLCAVGFYS